MRPIPSRIIFARDSFPYLGGSSTYLYLLFESLQARLPNAECWNIVSPRMLEIGKSHFGLHWPNPKGLKNVRTFLVDGKKGRSNLRRALREKPIASVISKSRRTTTLLKKMGVSIPIWHLTSTCSLVKNAIARNRFASMEDVIRRLRTNRFPKLRSAEEQQAIRLADRILFHTKSMQLWYFTFYPQFREKMEDEIFWDYPLIKRQFRHVKWHSPWERRSIDLLFVASDWRRPEKNFTLLKKICQAFKGKKIMVIGFLPTERLPGSVISFISMSQEEVVQAMVQAKVLVSPSRYDEAPNVLFEAAIAGTNVVCSKNCGNYRLADEHLVAELELSDFVEKAKLALQKYFPPRTAYFAKHDLRGWIIEEMSVLERSR